MSMIFNAIFLNDKKQNSYKIVIPESIPKPPVEVLVPRIGRAGLGHPGPGEAAGGPGRAG